MTSRFHFIALIPPFVLLVFWWWITSQGLANPDKLPSPVAVWSAFYELLSSGRLKEHVGASLYRVASGFGITLVFAVPLGLVLGWYRGLGQALGPLSEMFRTISPISWIPIAIIWFGIGDQPAIFIIFVATFFPLLLATKEAVTQVDPLFLRVAKDLGADNLQVLTKVLLPACVPYVFTGARLSLGIGWLVIVAAEMVGTNSGLGYLISDARYQSEVDSLFAGILVIALVGLFIDQILGLIAYFLERRGLINQGASNE